MDRRSFNSLVVGLPLVGLLGETPEVKRIQEVRFQTKRVLVARIIRKLDRLPGFRVKKICVYGDPCVFKTRRIGWYGWIEFGNYREVGASIDVKLNDFGFTPDQRLSGTAVDRFAKRYAEDTKRLLERAVSIYPRRSLDHEKLLNDSRWS